MRFAVPEMFRIQVRYEGFLVIQLLKLLHVILRYKWRHKNNLDVSFKHLGYCEIRDQLSEAQILSDN